MEMLLDFSEVGVKNHIKKKIKNTVIECNGK
jgi:hypothetical protein